MPSTLDKVRKALVWEKKKTAFAWAKYYEQLEENQRSNIGRYQVLQSVNENAETPQFVIDEMKDMIAKLKLELECPVCMEIIDPKQIEITRCGHKYCKTCVERIKETTQQCALCRKPMKPRQ